MYPCVNMNVSSMPRGHVEMTVLRGEGGVANLRRKEGRLREPYTINTDKEEEGGEAEIPKI